MGTGSASAVAGGGLSAEGIGMIHNAIVIAIWIAFASCASAVIVASIGCAIERRRRRLGLPRDDDDDWRNIGS